jgi:hypothetical protein
MKPLLNYTATSDFSRNAVDIFIFLARHSTKHTLSARAVPEVLLARPRAMLTLLLPPVCGQSTALPERHTFLNLL